jgi:hypothetical protein
VTDKTCLLAFLGYNAPQLKSGSLMLEAPG